LFKFDTENISQRAATFLQQANVMIKFNLILFQMETLPPAGLEKKYAFSALF